MIDFGRWSARLAFWRRARDGGIVTPMDTPEYWTVSEAARQAHVTRPTVYEWLDKGWLARVADYRNNGKLAPLLDPAAVLALAEARGTIPPQ